MYEKRINKGKKSDESPSEKRNPEWGIQQVCERKHT
jgi:hypothetical protein